MCTPPNLPGNAASQSPAWGEDSTETDPYDAGALSWGHPRQPLTWAWHGAASPMDPRPCLCTQPSVFPTSSRTSFHGWCPRGCSCSSMTMPPSPRPPLESGAVGWMQSSAGPRDSTWLLPTPRIQKQACSPSNRPVPVSHTTSEGQDTAHLHSTRLAFLQRNPCHAELDILGPPLAFLQRWAAHKGHLHNVSALVFRRAQAEANFSKSKQGARLPQQCDQARLRFPRLQTCRSPCVTWEGPGLSVEPGSATHTHRLKAAGDPAELEPGDPYAWAPAPLASQDCEGH